MFLERSSHRRGDRNNTIRAPESGAHLRAVRIVSRRRRLAEDGMPPRNDTRMSDDELGSSKGQSAVRVAVEMDDIGLDLSLEAEEPLSRSRDLRPGLIHPFERPTALV